MSADDAVAGRRKAPGSPAASAADADALQGNPASAFASATSEPYHLIGAPGEPGFQNGWVNGGTNNSPAGFYKDPLGVVHLSGAIGGGANGQVAFTLPAAYRRDENLFMPAAALSPGVTKAAFVMIESDGDVSVSCEAGCTLAGIDGLSYRVP